MLLLFHSVFQSKIYKKNDCHFHRDEEIVSKTKHFRPILFKQIAKNLRKGLNGEKGKFLLKGKTILKSKIPVSEKTEFYVKIYQCRKKELLYRKSRFSFDIKQ